ncbi:MAG: hypothetical protein ACT4NU_09380 [Chromatiales bacterium]
MKSKLLNLVAAMFTGVMAAMAAQAQVVPPSPPATPGSTDDTEIFFNPVNSASVVTTDDTKKPNVLFILDTSGSMTTLVGTTGKTRLQTLKDAMTFILDDPDVFNGINAGLMHFGGFHPNQPIYYPIRPLTAAANTVDNGPTAPPPAGTTATVRDRLKFIVNRLQANGGTPIVSTLYEATRYLEGATIDYGAFESSGTATGANVTPASTPDHGVSHRASVSGGTFQNPVGTNSTTCLSATEATPSPPGSSRCRRIVGTPAPTYISPLTQDRGPVFGATGDQPPCAQADYVIFLTDGDPTYLDTATRNNAWTLTKHTGTQACVANSADVNTGFGTNLGRCAIELAAYLHNPPDNPAIPPTPPATTSPDLRPSQPGQQWVILHTIAFNLSDSASGTQFLQQVAAAGGGNGYAANNAAELIQVFTQILSGALNQTTSFATPSFATNVFNRLFSRNEAYVSLFLPSNRPRWHGNVKKYKVCAPNALDAAESCQPPNPVTGVQTCSVKNKAGTLVSCNFGDILDALGVNIIDPATGNISDSATDFWNPVTGDGSNIEEGGAGSVLKTLDPATRQLYTYTGTYEFNAGDPNQTGGGRPAPSFNPEPLTGHPLATTNTALTEAMFGPGVTPAEKDLIINWIRNPDDLVSDEDGDGIFGEPIWRFEDPFHAGALPIEYGGGAAADTKVFVPSNGGGLRMLNGDTGVEEWLFIPKEMLRIQRTMRNNVATGVGGRTYGLDATPLPWLQDDNNATSADGIVPDGDFADGNDFVRLIFGQRDGGRAYYAVDVTTPANPKLMWKIEGGTVAGAAGTTAVTPGFADLANSWSTPVLGTVRVGTTLKTVVIFGGGNDTVLNNQFGPNSPTTNPTDPTQQLRKGNIVYIVDALTGELITSIGGPSGLTGTLATFTATTPVNEMTYPVTSSITAFDANGDGTTDRLYFFDLGGNGWRADLFASLSVGGSAGDVARIADLSAPDDTASAPSALVTDTRSFYFAPEVVRIDNAEFGGRFDMVVAVAGHRAHPLNGNGTPSYLGEGTVVNSVYAIKDVRVNSLSDPLPGGLTYPVTPGDLLDVTADPLQKDINGNPVNPAAFDTALASLQTLPGWRIELTEDTGPVGEKGFSRPLVLANKLFFTTYIPPSAADNAAKALICEVAEGVGRTYGIDLLTGAALFRQFDGDDTQLTKSDRYIEKLGVPSELGVTVYEEGILIPGIQGATPGTTDPGIGLPRGRIYWNER